MNQSINQSLEDIKLKLREEVLLRKIPYLVHFTHRKNLKSILENGLCTRSYLEENQMNFESNDPMRLECSKIPLKGICLSIAHPNTFLLEKFRKEKKLYHSDTYIIRIDPKVIWEKACVFCETNAAKSGYKLNYTAEHFSSLFKNNCGGYPREEGLADYFPTNIQAEIICIENIGADYFLDLSIYSTNNKRIEIYTMDNKVYFAKYPYLFGDRHLECLPLVGEK
ncbi:DUF4433 domain-containing protein [[Haemophilus] felis]|nr:DUF4433 domain-containing protein [[Haemophilus] felis]